MSPIMSFTSNRAYLWQYVCKALGICGDIVTSWKACHDQLALTRPLHLPYWFCFYTTPSDETARIFSSAFYHALIAGNYTVKKAFENAVTAVRNGRFDVDVSAVTDEDPKTSEVFLLLPESEFGDKNRPWLICQLRDLTSTFHVGNVEGNPKLITPQGEYIARIAHPGFYEVLVNDKYS